MPRDYKVYVDDILEAIAKVKRFTVGFDSKTFPDDEKTFDAVIRNLEVVKKIPEEIRVQYPNVEWKKIAGVRDVLIHEYFGIDAEIVWDIIQNKLPILETQIAKIVAES